MKLVVIYSLSDECDVAIEIGILDCPVTDGLRHACVQAHKPDVPYWDENPRRHQLPICERLYVRIPFEKGVPPSRRLGLTGPAPTERKR